MSRYDAASDAARNLLDGFDEVDLAELAAEQQARNQSLQQQAVQAHTTAEQLRTALRNAERRETEIRALLAGVDIRDSAAAWDLGIQVLLVLDGAPAPEAEPTLGELMDAALDELDPIGTSADAATDLSRALAAWSMRHHVTVVRPGDPTGQVVLTVRKHIAFWLTQLITDELARPTN